SSRRRHTRFSRDWSSDVCSSDLHLTVRAGQFEIVKHSVAAISPDRRMQALLIAFAFGSFVEGAAGFGTPVAISAALLIGLGFSRSEERRVGKECGARWRRYQ